MNFDRDLLPVFEAIFDVISEENDGDKMAQSV